MSPKQKFSISFFFIITGLTILATILMGLRFLAN
ncbi:MAG: hypothetical protein ACD_61C00276G0006 [uncultured bacterium]|nr:MAG: hypothetical protein ACD_61C00276G0006 [uncultured bacterium]